jgi:hypothetical protein
MHQPPAVSWDVKSARWHAGALIFWVLADTFLLVGFFVTQGWGASTLVLLLVLVASALLAMKGWYGAPVGQLNWDGAQWHWVNQDTHALTSVVCVLDLQTRMLVRISGGQGPSRWLWLERDASGMTWVALRRAIFANQRAAVVDPFMARPGQ